MKLRFYHKMLLLAVVAIIAGILVLVAEAFTLRRCRIAATLMNLLSDIGEDIELQRSYLDQFILRPSGKQDFDVRRQIEETAEKIDGNFANLEDLDKRYPALGLASLKESWETIRGIRFEIMSGRDVIRNNALSRSNSVVFRQKLIASFAQSQEIHSLLLSRVFRLALLYIVILAAMLAAMIWLYWRDVICPLRNIGSYLSLNNPQGKASSGTLLPEPSEIEADLRGVEVKSREDMNAKDSFFASMSHEIRTPLNGAIGFLDSLGETDLNPQQKQYLNLIKSSANSLRHVIDDVLDLSKINSGKLELESIAFDFSALLEECVAYATQLCRSKKNVKIIYRFSHDEGLPEKGLVIRSDPMRLRQVIDNLLSNAVKFTEHGEVALAVAAREKDGSLLEFDVSVKDTGIGMTAEEIDRLFKPYSQANKSTARRYGGTGLGLVICDNIVRLLGGKLTVTSKRMEGSEFKFSFTAPMAKHEEQLRLTGNFQVTLPANELKKKFALLVDDTPTNLFLLETICQGTGLPYTTAQNGLEAVKRCSEDKFDIIFMDIQMPIMDGYTAMKEIRKMPNTGATHIVALTASAYQEDVARALESGANSFIPKPFERNQLLLCIADALAIEPQRSLKSQYDEDESEEEVQVRMMHDYMRERYSISLGEIKMILAQTAADWRPVLDSLALYSKKGQIDDVKAILHKLKGQLSSIGLQEFADASADIMLHINAGDDSNAEIQSLIDSLSAIFRVLEKQVTIR